MQKWMLLLLLAVLSFTDVNNLTAQVITDSLRLQLDKVDGEKRLDILTQLCISLCQNDPPEAEKYGEEGLELARELNDSPAEAKLYRYLGVIQHDAGNREGATSFIKKAIAVYEEIDDHKGLASCLFTLGSFYGTARQYDRSVAHLSEALHIYDSLRIYDGIVVVKNAFGNHYTRLGDYATALEYYEEVIDLMSRHKTKAKATTVFMNKGQMLHKLGKSSEAIDIYFEVLKQFKSEDNLYKQAMIYEHIGALLKDNGLFRESLDYYLPTITFYDSTGHVANKSNVLQHCGSAYLELKEYPRALEYYNEALQLKEASNMRTTGNHLRGIAVSYQKMNRIDEALKYFRMSKAKLLEVNDSLGLNRLNTNLAEVYLELDSFEIARKLCLDGLNKFTRSTAVSDKIEIYENLISICKKQNDYEEALNYQGVLDILRDSLYGINKMHKISKKLVQEELIKKEDQILELKQMTERNEDEISYLQKQSRLSRRGVYLTILIGAITFLILLLWILRYRQRKYKENTELQNQVEDLNLARKDLLLKLELAENGRGSDVDNSIIHTNGEGNQLMLNEEDQYTMIRMDQIIKIAAKRNHSIFYMEDNRTLIANQNLKHFDETLPSDLFFRIHRSFIINLKKVEKIEPGRTGKVFLSDGSSLDIAARRKSKFLNIMANNHFA